MLVALLVGADRAGVVVTERALADGLQRSAALPSRPEVDVRGVPFLTQALEGRYDRIDVVAHHVPVGTVGGPPVTVSRLSATLRGARMPLSDVVSGAVTSVPVDGIVARALVPFDVVRRSSEIADLAVAPEGDRLRLRGTVRVFGQDVTGSALGRLTVDDGQVVVTAESFDVGGELASRLLTRGLAGRFDARLPLGALPYGLRVDGVTVQDEGLAVTGHADDAVLSPPAP